MVNIISKNGMFFKEIPFNLENAKAIQSGTKRGFVVLDNGINTYDVRIIATDIKDGSYPIVVAVDCGSEAVVSVTTEGMSSMNGTLRIYIPTRINTYEAFIPALYQSCLVRVKHNENGSWMVNVCNGYQDDGKTPTFFGMRTDTEMEYVPLCKATLPLNGLCNVSWKSYITAHINMTKDED